MWCAYDCNYKSQLPAIAFWLSPASSASADLPKVACCARDSVSNRKKSQVHEPAIQPLAHRLNTTASTTPTKTAATKSTSTVSVKVTSSTSTSVREGPRAM